MATRPATRPEARPRAVGLPRCSHSASIQLRAAAGGGDLRDGQGQAGLGVGPQGAAAVEPEPAEPQQARADERQHHAVGVHGVFGVAAAARQHQDGRQRGEAGGDVDDGAAREVERPHLAEPADRLRLELGVGDWMAQTQWASGS